MITIEILHWKSDYLAFEHFFEWLWSWNKFQWLQPQSCIFFAWSWFKTVMKQTFSYLVLSIIIWLSLVWLYRHFYYLQINSFMYTCRQLGYHALMIINDWQKLNNKASILIDHEQQAHISFMVLSTTSSYSNVWFHLGFCCFIDDFMHSR